MTPHRLALALAASSLIACGEATPPPVSPPPPAPVACPSHLQLPATLQGKAVVVLKGDPDEARANLVSAVKRAGEGQICDGLVVRLTADIEVWRMWSGPDKKDKDGYTNRLGPWWAYDAPHGTQQRYRNEYEICQSWNDLTHMTKCALKKGAVVAIGPGQSVFPPTCKDTSGKPTAESFPVSPDVWQVYVDKPWTRSVELVCPPEASDYKADPREISRPAQ